MPTFFKTAQNIVVTGGSFNDIHGNIHTYNSIQATNVDSLPNINPPVNFYSHQPLVQHVHESPVPGHDYVSPAPSYTSNSTFGSSGSIVNSYTGIDQSIHQFISQTIVPEPPEFEESPKIEEIDDAEDVVSDEDLPMNRTYQFYNCQTVYMNSFNARGVKVKDSGNNFPQVTHHGGTVVVRPSNDVSQGAPSSSKSSQPRAASDQPPRCLDAPPELTFGSPPIIPPLPFQRREDTSSSSSAGQPKPPVDPASSVPGVKVPSGPGNQNPFLNQSIVIPPANVPPPALGEGQTSMSSRKRDKLPATMKIQSDDSTTCQYTSKKPAPTTLPDAEFHPLPIRPFLPKHMGIYSNYRSPPLKAFAGDIQSIPPNNSSTNATNSSQDSLDNYSKRLEHHLDSALANALIIHTSGTSSSAEILTPRARNTLKALNALVSTETPVPSPGTKARSTPATRFKSIKKVGRWLRISRSPNETIPR